MENKVDDNANFVRLWKARMCLKIFGEILSENDPG